MLKNIKILRVKKAISNREYYNLLFIKLFFYVIALCNIFFDFEKIDGFNTLKGKLY